MDILRDCPFCNKELEIVNHIFVTCELTYNVRTTISRYYPSPVDMNENTIGWLEYIWNYRKFDNKFFPNFMEKMIIIL